MKYKASQVELVVKNLPLNAGDERCRFDPWVGEIPWSRKWHPISVCLRRSSMGRGVCQATVPGAAKSWR